MALAKYAKEKEIFGSKTLFRSIGFYLCRHQYYERSLRFFDLAVQKNPDDVFSLRGRSRSRAKTCDYQGALKDVYRALHFGPDDLCTLADKALITYLHCEFEQALIQNSRLLPLREKPEDFALGLMHCTDAIENSIGERAGRPLRDHFMTIRRLAWSRYFEEEKAKATELLPKRKKRRKKLHLEDETGMMCLHEKMNKGDTGGIRDSIDSYKFDTFVVPPFGSKFHFHPLQRHTTNIKNYMAERYLDAMYRDKVFLENFTTKQGVINSNQNGSKKILQIANNAYKKVSYKQEILRARKPFYHYKFQEVEPKGALKRRKEAELLMTQETIKKEADVILNRIRRAYQQNDVSTLVVECDKLREYCDSNPKRVFPDKDTYTRTITGYYCDSLYSLNRLNKKQYEWDREKRAHLSLGLPISRVPSTDSVVRHLAPAIFDPKSRAEEVTNRLKKATDPSEICMWLYELCKASIATKQYDLAKVYGKRCVQQGTMIDNRKWVVNATLLLAKIGVLQQNLDDATKEINAALVEANYLRDAILKQYLEKCLEIVNKIVFDDVIGPKIVQRQMKLVEMMGTPKMKDELAYIFKTMASMPASRRLNVIPGVPLDFKSTTSKKGARTMSIAPKMESSSSRNVNFRETIEYS